MQITAEKNLLRKEYRVIRSESGSTEKDNAIFNSLIGCEMFLRADTVFTYYSVNSEVDTLKLIDYALKEGKKVALPRCSDDNGNMKFYFVDNTDSCLSDGMFSLKEPNTDICAEAVYGKNNICVVPALAFDVQGFRLGYGKGYYDRFLSNFQGKSVGLCYDECLCEKLPSDEYDQKVNIIITDKKIYELK